MKILSSLNQSHTRVYRELQAGLYQSEQASSIVEELQLPIGVLATIKTIVERFQSKTEENYIGGDSLLREVEIDISDGDSNNKAQIDEFSNDGLYFEP